MPIPVVFTDFMFAVFDTVYDVCWNIISPITAGGQKGILILALTLVAISVVWRCVGKLIARK